MAASVASISTNPKTKLPFISGVKSSTKSNQLLTSCGVPSIDILLGGGLPVGSICVFEETDFGIYSKYIADCFAAQGIVCGHSAFVVDYGPSNEDYFKLLPSPISVQNFESIPLENDILNKEAAIAWRYKNLTVVESSLDASASSCNYFNRKKQIDEKLLEKCELHSVQLTSEECNWSLVLNRLNTVLSNDAYRIETLSKKNLMRIVFTDFGSPLWGSSIQLIKFLCKLKCLLRNRLAIAFLTIPTRLFSEEILVRINHYSDASFRLEPFETSQNNEKVAPFDNYNGLLRIQKLPLLNSINFSIPDCLDLAFKWKKDKLIIDKLHTPPSFSDSTESSKQPASGLGCSSNMSRSKLDF